MAKQTIIWTALPNGRETDGPYAGQLRISIVISPRLTPESGQERFLKAFHIWRNWPASLEQVKLAVRIGTKTVELVRNTFPDPGLWAALFPDDTPVSGFVFKDMSQVNLRSFAVRNILDLARRHYGRMAVQAASTHPTLLPWRDAHPDLKNMLSDYGTRTQTVSTDRLHIEVMEPGFNRLLDPNGKNSISQQLDNLVFNPESRFGAPLPGIGTDSKGNPSSSGKFPVRALPPDWMPPATADNEELAALMGQWKTAAEYTLYQANRFYQRTVPTQQQQAMRRPSMTGIPPAPALPDMDFHRIVASFSDYPALLRRLGLIIDAYLPPDSPVDAALANAEGAQGLMRVLASWSQAPDGLVDICPGTAWEADRLIFTARPRTADHARGRLQLRDANDQWAGGKRGSSLFDVHQVDPDGSALKTVNFVLSAQNLIARSLAIGSHGAVTYTTGDKQALAALRSAGLGISRHGRAGTVAQNAAAAALKNQAIEAGPASASKIALFAEDILRGYRIDVQQVDAQDQGPWRSLCWRHGDFRLVATGNVLELPDDEGYVKGASTSSALPGTNDGQNPDDHYLHETLFRWAGWSLAVPRPGRTLRSRDDPDTGVQTETPETVADTALDGGNGLAVQFKPVRGSLPRLRYGATYRFRARLVDLAGNSLALDDPELEKNEIATDPVFYGRFEPVDPPAMIQRARSSEGESLQHMVIRSDWNEDTASYLQTPAFSAAIALPASADFEYTEQNERHLVPPKSSQLQCETHGVFDTFWTDADGIRQAYAIASREAKSLYDLPSGSIELITPSRLANVSTTSTIPPRLPSVDNPTGDRIAPGEYVIFRGASAQTPYLPDCAAGGLALRGLPGHSLPGVTQPIVLGPSAVIVMSPTQELVLMVSYAGAWPDSQGLRIVLAERAIKVDDPPCSEHYKDEGLPAWDEEQRTLTLFVPKGHIVRLRYSSFVHPAYIDAFGLPGWTESSAAAAFVKKMASVGCEWMMTPYVPLVLTHASQRPVCEPRWQTAISIKRDPGALYADLSARISLHGPSTGKIEVQAQWEEWIDDPDEPAPRLQAARGALGEIMLPENGPNQLSLRPAIDAQIPPPPVNQLGNDAPHARGDRHEFGDTKFRLIRYALLATTRFREYFPEALYEQAEQVTRLGPAASGQNMQTGVEDDPGAPFLEIDGSAMQTVVPASAPPDKPDVHYVIPTFRWDDSTVGQSRGITRYGNGLRIWLGRPWFSSGNGELLGIIIHGDGDNFTGMEEAVSHHVTQWGMDPLWDSSLPSHRSRVTDFPDRVADEPVALREHPGKMFHVIGHRVHWDDARRLWYCDVTINPGAGYMPFVRLALVRYQPNAIDSAKVSQVVQSQFAQLLPRRRAVFTRNGSRLDISLHGYIPAKGPMEYLRDSEYTDISFIPGFGQTPEAGRNKVEVVLQQRDASIDSDLAWNDVSVLASGLAGEPNEDRPPLHPDVLPPPSLFTAARAASADIQARQVISGAGGSRPAASAATGQGPRLAGPAAIAMGAPGISAPGAILQNISLGSLDLGNIDLGRLDPGSHLPDIGQLLDPSFWSATVSLPPMSSVPTRIAVREYERFYTDETVSETRAGARHQRRIVEERLVYCVFYDNLTP